MQQEYQANLAAMEQQLRDMYEVAAAANAADRVTTEDGQQRQFFLGRDQVSRAYDRLRAQAILEGKPSDSDESEASFVSG